MNPIPTKSTLKVLHEINGELFIALDSSIARLLRLKDGNLIEQKLSPDGVLLAPYEREAGA